MVSERSRPAPSPSTTFDLAQDGDIKRFPSGYYRAKFNQEAAVVPSSERTSQHGTLTFNDWLQEVQP